MTSFAEASDETCPTSGYSPNQGQVFPSEFTPVLNLSATALDSSVSLVNRDLKASVEAKVATFRANTLMLATKDPSKEALADWYFNMVAMNKVAMEEVRAHGLIKNDSAIQRLALAIIDGIVSSWITRSALTTMHEKGHGEAFAASGAIQISYATMNHPTDMLSIGDLFTHLLAGGKGALTYGWGDFTPRQKATIAGAGLNQQNTFSDSLARETVNRGQFHEAEYLDYLMNKFSIPYYYLLFPLDHSSSNDLSNYTQQLANQGLIRNDQVPATQKKLAQYSAAAGLLSGRTWEGFEATSRFIKSGKTTAQTIQMKTAFGNISWPEVSTYLNSEGISARVETKISPSSTVDYDLSLERSLIGQDITEASLTANLQKGPLKTTLSATFNSDHRVGSKIQLAYDIGQKDWFVYGGITHDNGTLAGQRLFYNPGQWSSQIYTGVGYRY